jgi:uncharacterized protein
MRTPGMTTCPNTRRSGIIAYLAIAFGFAWAWRAVVLYGLGLHSIWALLPGMFAPAIAAILLTGFNYPHSPILGLVLFTAFAILMSVVLGWLQLRAGSSWAPSLAHSGIDYFASPILGAVFPGASALVVGIGGAIALPAYALVAGWIVATGRLRSRSAALPTPVRPDLRTAA